MPHLPQSRGAVQLQARSGCATGWRRRGAGIAFKQRPRR